MKIIIAITLAVIAAAVGYLARAEHDRRRAAEELAERLRHAAFLADLRELCFYPGSTVERPDAEDVCYAYRTAAGIPHPPPPSPEQLDLERDRLACFASTTPKPCEDFAREHGYNPRERPAGPADLKDAW